MFSTDIAQWDVLSRSGILSLNRRYPKDSWFDYQGIVLLSFKINGEEEMM